MKVASWTAAILLLLSGRLAFRSGTFANALAVFMMVMLPFFIGITLIRATRNRLALVWWRGPIAGSSHPFLFQATIRLVFWLVAAATIQRCAVRVQFAPGHYQAALVKSLTGPTRVG